MSANKAKRIFDPRVQFATIEDQEAARVVWCTTNVDWAREALANSLPLKKGLNPFFVHNVNFRRAGLNFEFQGGELAEFVRCKLDIINFAEKHCKLVTETGLIGNIKLRKYQKRMLRAMQTQQYVVILSGRQIGKTTTTAIFLLWKLIFHKQQSIALLADKSSTAINNLNLVKQIMENLPFYLKPGVVGMNMSSMVLDNRSKIFTGPCKKSALVGKTINVLYIDELAIPTPKQSKELVEYAFPTIAALGKNGQIIASSTPSGDNIFKDLCIGAIQGKNGFHFVQVNWWDVPGRDLAWKHAQIKLYGLDAFNEQFNCKFLSSTNTIFSDAVIESLERQQQQYMKWQDKYDDDMQVLHLAHDYINEKGRNLLSEVEPVQFLKLDKRVDFDFENTYWLVQCDLAEGGGGDDTVFNFFEINVNKKTQFNDSAIAAITNDLAQPTSNFDSFLDSQVDDIIEDDLDNVLSDYDITLTQRMIWRSNSISLKTAALFLRKLLTTKFNLERLKVCPELNTYGGKFLQYLTTETVGGGLSTIEYENIARTLITEERSVAGVQMTPRTKKLYVPNAKLDVERGKIIINEFQTVFETKHFGQLKGSYCAAPGYKDDTVMTIVGASAYTDSMNDDWISFVEEIIENNFASDYDDPIW